MFGHSPQYSNLFEILNGYLLFRSTSVLTRMMWSMLLLLSTKTLSTDAGVLPTDFSIQYKFSGADLVWSASDKKLAIIGGARPEFRFSDGTVLGYPRQNPKDGLLTMSLTGTNQELLMKNQEIEVWSAGKRIDNRGQSVNQRANIFGSRSRTNYTPTPRVKINPATIGNYTAKRLTYSTTGLNYSSFPEPLEILAEVTYPDPLPLTSPFVLFLHGRHSYCYNPNSTVPDDIFGCWNWPCDEGCLPIPSYQGYRYVTDILASQGFITISISANSINAQDFFAMDAGADARSVLIRHHLSLWARWNTAGGDPWRGRFRWKVDLTNVVLVGHSRGGEGVNRAAIDIKASDAYRIVGLVSYGPTAFGSQVTPDIHSATILPGKSNL
jgi:hypothetical protein